MNNTIRKEVFIGIIGGIVATIAGTALCTFIIAQVRKESFDHVLETFKSDSNFWMLLALGAIPNLLLFFAFLRKDLEYRARGVLLATFAVAMIVFALNLF